jgi:hypothetical protein
LNLNHSDQYIQANLKARIVSFGYIVFMILIAMLLMYGLDDAIPQENASQDELRQSTASLGQQINIFAVFTLIHAIFFCWYFVRLANSSIRTGKFPPPGTWVIVRTKIRTGKSALVSAYASYFLAVFMWLPVAIPVYLKWILGKFT